MQKRKLGYTPLQLTTIGLGTWAMGGGDWKFGWGAQDDSDSINTVRRAIDLGINWVDTAFVYGFGHSEEVTGRAVKELKQKPIIATKCSRLPVGDGSIKPCLKKESIQKECEGSLKRLGVEAIDLYQLHWPQPDEDIEEGWGAMADLVKSGKVRYAGVCNFSLTQLKRIQPIHPVASLQPPYSMIERDVEKELLAYCAAQNIGVVGYSPMQKGLLTGSFSPQRLEALAANDHRRNDPRFKEPLLGINLTLVEGLRPIAARNNRSLGQLAIAWTLRRPEVTSSIVGARRPAQIEETAAAGDWILAKRDIDEIESLLAGRQQALTAV